MASNNGRCIHLADDAVFVMHLVQPVHLFMKTLIAFNMGTDHLKARIGKLTNRLLNLNPVRNRKKLYQYASSSCKRRNFPASRHFRCLLRVQNFTPSIKRNRKLLALDIIPEFFDVLQICLPWKRLTGRHGMRCAADDADIILHSLVEHSDAHFHIL